MFGIPGRPQAEAVVVFGGDDDALHAGFFGYACPLAAVQLGGVECGGAFGAVAPFQIGEGVDVEVDEGIVVELMPGLLPFGGSGAEGSGGRGLAVSEKSK